MNGKGIEQQACMPSFLYALECRCKRLLQVPAMMNCIESGTSWKATAPLCVLPFVSVFSAQQQPWNRDRVVFGLWTRAQWSGSRISHCPSAAIGKWTGEKGRRKNIPNSTQKFLTLVVPLSYLYFHVPYLSVHLCVQFWIDDCLGLCTTHRSRP